MHRKIHKANREAGLAAQIEVHISECCRTGRTTLLQLPMLARHFAISERLLTEIFRKQYGSSIHQYIIQIRFEYVCELLLDPKLTVKEIAIQMGYLELSNFSRDFSRRSGISPLEWRVNHLSNLLPERLHAGFDK